MILLTGDNIALLPPFIVTEDAIGLVFGKLEEILKRID